MRVHLPALALLIGCQSGAYDPAALQASTEAAMRHADAQAVEEGMERDPAELSDAELIEAARVAADLAVEEGCRVEGVLGGTFDIDESGLAGGHSGRWFALDQVDRGGVVGTWTDEAERRGGLFAGDWEAEDGRFGTVAGEWDTTGDEGTYLGDYEETEGPALGTAGGLWYEFSSGLGGYYLGVWGECSGEGSGAVPAPV